MQYDLLDYVDRHAGEFAGAGYEPNKDRKRLEGQIERVFRLMRDGKWRTLPEIAKATGDPEASISAQLRHLRKEKFGKNLVEKRRRGPETNGLWEYKLTPNGVFTKNSTQN